MSQVVNAPPHRSFWDRILGSLLPLIRLNAVRVEETRIIKRRNPFGRHILPAANWFFRWSRAPISFWRQTSSWARWEVTCYHMLHPQFHARALEDGQGVCMDRLPGESLWTHLRRKTLTREMLHAAGAEFRRAHEMPSAIHRGLWSHGDAAMCNVLYDPQAHAARFIDFEIIHNPDVPAVNRQADDLYVFLVDLAGFTSRRQWLPFATEFLQSYGRLDVIGTLRQRLIVPGGRARIWWKIRANFVSTLKIRRRLERLGRAVDHGACGTDALTGPAADRLRHKPRPSAHCQAMTPGTPKTMSLAR